MALAWHIVLRVLDNRVLAPTRERRLHVVRTVSRISVGHAVLAFALADTHMHLVVVGSRAQLGRLCQRIGSSLQQTCRFGPAMGPAHFTEVRNQAHLSRSVAYVWRQHEHHGLPPSPAAECTNLPDVVGARVLFRASGPALADHLPRLRARDHWPGGWAPTQSLDWRWLFPAAASAIARTNLDRAPRGGAARPRDATPSVHAARAAAVQVACRQSDDPRSAARASVARLPSSSRHRLRTQPAAAVLQEAVRMQLALRSAPLA